MKHLGVMLISEKRIRSRSIVLAVVLVCVVLIVPLSVSLMNNSGLNTEIKYLQNQIHVLTQDKQGYQNIVNLALSSTIVSGQKVTQTANNYSNFSFLAEYAGYVYVQIDNSTTTNNYVEVIYMSHNLSSPYSVSFNQKLPINGNGSASFPVLPSSNVEVRIGNTNPVDGVTQTITINYYY